ncbi:MAG: helix-turn-helix domain-containing protein [Gemmataceae bacterium]|nr:helix-turn-helix domain-containing protein [Gemmataceae bacterium]
MYLTVDQVAERLQTSVQTVWRLLRGGRLRGVKLARQWRIGEADLLAYLQTLTDQESK